VTFLFFILLGIFVVFALLIADLAHAQGRAEGYREGCDDCKRGVIPQHRAKRPT
jgi:hypothetical protein